LHDSKVLYFGKYVGLARQSSFFLLLSQKKETKEKATTCRFILNFKQVLSGSRKLASLKQPPTELSQDLLKIKARQKWLAVRVGTEMLFE